MTEMIRAEWILLAAGFLILCLPRNFGRWAALLGSLLALVQIFRVESDRLSFLFGLAFCIAALLGSLYTFSEKTKYPAAAAAFYGGSALGVVFAVEWIFLLIYWEMMAVSSWALVRMGGTKEASAASFRYLGVHLLGGNLLLLGVVMKLLQGERLIECLTGQGDLAYWCIFLGIAINAAIPPFNGWVGDAYPQASGGGTFYLGTYTTKAGVYCLLRFFAGEEMLLYAGVFMALYGAALALLENDLKRLLSYHIVSQLGYMIAALSLGSELGVDGAAAHAFHNVLYKGTLFLCAGAVIAATGERKISRLGGLGKKMPVTAFCFLTAASSITGIPLFSGFVSKGLIMNGLAESGHWAAELLLLLAGIGTLFSILLKGSWFIFFGTSRSDGARKAKETTLPWSMKAAMAAGAFSCILFGLMPELTFSLTPFAVKIHLFTVDHVTQYVELLAAAALVFLFFSEHMMPADKIILDTDWFYRKPLKQAGKWILNGCLMLFRQASAMTALLVKRGYFLLQDPAAYISTYLGVKKKEKLACLEEDDVLQQPVGLLIAVNFIILLGIAVLVVLLLAKE